MKNSVCITMLVVLLLALSACGGSSEENSDQNKMPTSSSSLDVDNDENDLTPEEDWSPQGGGHIDWPLNCYYGSILEECVNTQGFLAYRKAYGDYHLGKDLSTYEMEPIYAPNNCKVVYSTFRPGSKNWGGIIALQFDKFYMFVGHIDDATRPPKGKTFKKGDIIGYAEKKGIHPWGLHIHVQGAEGNFYLPSGRLSPAGYSTSTNTIYCDIISYMIRNCSSQTDTSGDNNNGGNTGGGGEIFTYPRNIQVSTPSSRRVWISWIKLSTASKTYIYWGTSSNVTQYSNKMETTTSEYAHDGVVIGYSYYYRIASVNASGVVSELSPVYSVYISY